jgi:hypothetical protein
MHSESPARCRNCGTIGQNTVNARVDGEKVVIEMNFPEAAVRGGRLSLLKSRPPEEFNFRSWVTSPKFMASAANDRFRQNRKSASHFLLGFLLFGRMAGISLNAPFRSWSKYDGNIHLICLWIRALKIEMAGLRGRLTRGARR